MKYPIVIERAENNYSAYFPDLPGCVATGKTPTETVLKENGYRKDKGKSKKWSV